MRKFSALALCLMLTFIAWQALHIGNVHAGARGDWSQWGRTPQHSGASTAVGQNPTAQLAAITFDPFAAKEQHESAGPLLAHYQVPLVDGNTVILEYKTGAYVSCDPPGSHLPYPCGPDAWNREVWNERAYTWKDGTLVEKWTFPSDWKPEPNSDYGGRNENLVGLFGWEPVFHAATGHGFVYVPGFSGSVWKLREDDGSVADHFTPFGSYGLSANIFVSGPLTLDAAGNLYYNALALDMVSPWSADTRGGWLVKITSEGQVRESVYSKLVPDAPRMCFGFPCGMQRPGINVAPALSPDGKTLYTVSRAHFFPNAAYLVAVNADDLTTRWDELLFGLTGPGAIMFVIDQASSSPSVAADGSIFFGALSGGPSYMMKFSPAGRYLTAFHFGWDTTPAVYAHDGTYSLILKNNSNAGGPYYITQLNADLVPEWSFRDKTVDTNHPKGYEWCVNAPAVDANGTVYANSEDGYVYVIGQGGKFKGRIFLRAVVQAAYTPLAIGPDGKIYAENDGDMFVVGQ
jgi:outer membrane protein assembly factor BamB